MQQQARGKGAGRSWHGNLGDPSGARQRGEGVSTAMAEGGGGGRGLENISFFLKKTGPRSVAPRVA